MKHITLFAVALTTACCGSLSSKPAEPAESAVDQKLKAMELRMETRDEQYRRAIDELSKTNQDLARRVARQDQVISLVDATVNQMRDRPSPMTPVESGTVRATQPKRETAPEVPATTDQAARFAEIASVLRDPTFADIERLQRELSPHAAAATAFLLDEIARHPSDTQLAGRAEDLIGSFPADAVRTPLTQALNDPISRISAAQLIGHIADAAYADVLHPFTTDLDPSFRLSVAVAMVRCRDTRGIPYLIEGLESRSLADRIQSIQHLRRINRGETYGYDWQGEAEQNGGAVRQWRDWWDQMRDFVTLD